MTDDKTEDTMVAALLRERESLVLRDLPERVAQVDEQLKLRGHKTTDDAARQEPPKTPKARTSQQQTREGS